MLNIIKNLVKGLPCVERRGLVHPFDSFVHHCHQKPLVVWNLGGAADFTMLQSVMSNRYGQALSMVSEVDHPMRPILFMVSDSSSVVRKGLLRALNEECTEEKKRSCSMEFGFWGQEWKLQDADFAHHCFRPETDDEVERRPVTVVFWKSMEQRPLCLLYLHVRHSVAIDALIRPSELPIHLLVSTRRGTTWQSLFPPTGSLWLELMNGPTPLIWSCDSEIFPPPTDRGRLIESSGGYGVPGVWLSNW